MRRKKIFYFTIISLILIIFFQFPNVTAWGNIADETVSITDYKDYHYRTNDRVKLTVTLKSTGIINFIVIKGREAFLDYEYGDPYEYIYTATDIVETEFDITLEKGDYYFIIENVDTPPFQSYNTVDVRIHEGFSLKTYQIVIGVCVVFVIVGGTVWTIWTIRDKIRKRKMKLETKED